MKLKITDEKLDELAHLDRNIYCFSNEGVGAYNTGYLFCRKYFRAAEQVHQATVDKLMEIIEMQNNKLVECSEFPLGVKDDLEHYRTSKCLPTDFEIGLCDSHHLSVQNTLTETDKMLKELNEVSKV